MQKQKKLLWRDVDPVWTISDELRDTARLKQTPDTALLKKAADRLDAQDVQLKALVEIMAASMPVPRLLDLLFASGFGRMELVSLYGFDESEVIRAESDHNAK